MADIKHRINEDDIKRNPELTEVGVKVGDIVFYPDPHTEG